MSMPALPDWLPWWVPILVLVPALLYALAFLFMPFAVFGVKGRLEAVEARLDEIQGEIRSLALRMPEPVHHTHYDEAIYAAPPPGAPPRVRAEPVITRPPIPPAPHYLDDDRPDDLRAHRADPARTPRTGRGESGRGEPRAEPRLDWPR
jgi:hypothetical protein